MISIKKQQRMMKKKARYKGEVKKSRDSKGNQKFQKKITD
jgi:hypothetical protein